MRDTDVNCADLGTFAVDADFAAEAKLQASAQAVVPGWCQEANQSVIEGLSAVPG
jgi:hypothetical protein